METAEFIHDFQFHATLALAGVGFILAFLSYIVGRLIYESVREWSQERSKTCGHVALWNRSNGGDQQWRPGTCRTVPDALDGTCRRQAS